MISKTTALLAACLLIVSLPVGAQPSSKVARAVRLNGTAPTIDGRLDDEPWKLATAITEMVQQRPIEGGEPSERTEIRIAYDEGALYIGARMYRTDPDRIPRSVTRRDGQSNAERITITLDTQLDRRTGVAFGITAAGVRHDFRHTRDEDFMGRESQFDPVWEAAANIDSLGWVAEMRIPFSQLRFPAGASQRWGVQFDRWMPDKNEDLQWVMIPQSETGYISRFGTLEGIEGINPTRPVELTPYFAGDATRRAAVDPLDPFNDPWAGRAGLDAKFGIGSNITVDASINPDFGQVEADPAEVNLSAFETFFDERRPFFTEGSERLRGNGAQYFYSRRIGAAPRLSLDGDFVDIPGASTILGAAKLTGRLASRLSVGGLLAVTGRELGKSFFIDSGFSTTRAVEPRTAYGVLRLEREMGTQQSTLGAAFTTVRRDVNGEAGLAAILPSEALFGGLDWRIRMQQGRYAISGWAGFSHVAGDSLAIARLQRASARYFNRPDATHVTYDPRRTSMSGYTASIRADKDAGRRILWGAQVLLESPGFEINDFGRLQSTDDVEYNADIQIRETIPGRYLRNWRLGFDTRGAWNYGGAHQQNEWNQNLNVSFNNFMNLNARNTIAFRALNDALTRGGPYMTTPQEWRQELRLNGPMGARTGWRINFNFSRDEFGGHRESINTGLTLRPAPRWQLSVDPSYSSEIESRQYVTTVSGGRDETFGNRYVFSFIDRTTLATRFRLNYAFTPDLTLEAYAEPFLASGRYSRFGELAAPGSAELIEYGTSGTRITRDTTGRVEITGGGESFALSNRDFNVKSFRSNFVLRWEWNPGSTLFLVWQQNRRASEAIGSHVRFGDLFETTRAAGDNFLSLKVTYWFAVGR
ncbi:MAG: DUF5916 domain-containing protein [Gemmatimonadota bacterium]